MLKYKHHFQKMNKLENIVSHKIFMEKSLYECLWCSNFSSKWKHHAMDHIRSRHSLKKCPFCDLYGENNAIQKHKSKHPRKNEIKCENCGKTFARNGTLNIHLQRKSCLESTSKECEKCHVQYTSKRHFQNHTCKVKEAKNKTVECGMCSKKFVSSNAVIKHQMNIHGSIESNNVSEVKCRCCIKTFPSEEARNLHEANSHDFNSSQHLLRNRLREKYLIQEAITNGTMSCYYCDKVKIFKSVTGLKMHHRKAHKGKILKYNCPTDGHILKGNSKKHLCPQVIRCFHCRKYFWNWKDLLLDSVREHPDKSIKGYGIRDGINIGLISVPEFLTFDNQIIQTWSGNHLLYGSEIRLQIRNDGLSYFIYYKVCQDNDPIPDHVAFQNKRTTSECALCKSQKICNEGNRDSLSKIKKKLSKLEKNKLYILTNHEIVPL